MQPENDERLQAMLGSLATPDRGARGDAGDERADSFARAASRAGARSRRNLRIAAGAAVVALAAGTALLLGTPRGTPPSAPTPGALAWAPPAPVIGCDVRLLTIARLNASADDELVLPSCGGVNWVTRQRVLD